MNTSNCLAARLPSKKIKFTIHYKIVPDSGAKVGEINTCIFSGQIHVKCIPNSFQSLTPSFLPGIRENKTADHWPWLLHLIGESLSAFVSKHLIHSLQCHGFFGVFECFRYCCFISFSCLKAWLYAFMPFLKTQTKISNTLLLYLPPWITPQIHVWLPSWKQGVFVGFIHMKIFQIIDFVHSPQARTFGK